MSENPADILIDHCRFFERHAEAAKSLLESKGDAWCDYRDQLIASTSTLPHGGMVFLLGEMGRGKTQMCACMALSHLDRENRRDRRKRSARYIGATEFYMSFRDAIKRGREVETLREFAQPRLLFIDDAHEQSDTEHEKRSLLAVIDQRLYAKRWTVLIANRKRESLGEIIDGAIKHRAQEGKLFIEVKGRNWREGGGADA